MHRHKIYRRGDCMPFIRNISCHNGNRAIAKIVHPRFPIAPPPGVVL